MTEPLGQSQVLPYLVGLSERGVQVEILSFEPAETDEAAVEELKTSLRARHVEWQPLVRSPSHSVGRKLWEIGSASIRGLSMALAHKPDIVHARSYLPAAAADAISSVIPRAKLLFDLRGMLGDEYVDGGNWTKESLRYRALKLYERRLFRCAGGIVALTDGMRDYLRKETEVPITTPIEVIPCCVDTDRFRIDSEARSRTRAALGLEGRAVVVYSGTLGSWYMAREMAAFVSALRRRRSDVAWLVLTHADPSELKSLARAEGIAGDDIVVRKARPRDMPAMLAAGDLGISFIRPCFSKMGSSPTKVAEYLACGLAAVVNDGVGDMGKLAGTEGCVVVPARLDKDDIERAAARSATLLDQPHVRRAEEARSVAIARFSLRHIGVPRYAALYDAMCDTSAAKGSPSSLTRAAKSAWTARSH